MQNTRFRKTKSFWIIIIGTLCIAVFIVFSQFQLIEMASTSMEPTIIGRGTPPKRAGDTVLISRRIHHPLNRNDLVLVSLGGDAPLTTIRRVVWVPGDTIKESPQTNKIVRVQDGCYYLMGDSTNAIDSRLLGPISWGQVKGKVIWVIK